MPPAIQDSDDEDILFDDEPSQRSTFSQLANHAESVLQHFPDAVPQFDGAADKPSRSTSSSDLRRQVADAERGLLATNSDQASKPTTAMPSSTSPASQRNKRRNTTVVGSDPVISLANGLKRVKTYAHKRTVVDEDGDQYRASIGRPGGTLGNDFVNHEPNVMFRDSGTTNAFNDSTQEELVEQARGGNNAQNVNGIPVPKASNSDKSSSFPWTASAEPTQTEKSPAANDLLAQKGDDITVQQVSDLGRRPTIEPLSPVVKKPAFFTEPAGDQSGPQGKPAPPRSSPVVIIDTRAEDIVPDVPHDEPTEGTQKPKRGRKRKSQEAVQEQDQWDDRLNSDHRVLKEIGLPTENYPPRLSKRRATLVDEPLDNSLPVEKALRKRRKTENATTELPAASHSHTQTRSQDGFYECPLGCELRMKEEEMFLHLDQCPTMEGASQSKLSQGSKDNREKDKSQPEEKTDINARSGAKPATVEQNRKHPSRTSSVDAIPSSKPLGHPSSEKKTDLGLLMLPPTMLTSASKKGRRSKTTIFEDHVDFGGSQRSPNLSQQQAKRKAAMKNVKNESTQKSRRKVVPDDDDNEEDELAMEEADAEEPPPKQSRGRPAKATTQKPADSTEGVRKRFSAPDDEDQIELAHPAKPKARGRPKTVLEDSDDEEDVDLAAAKPPAKKGRGRPPKAKPTGKVIQDSDAEIDELEAEESVTKKARGRPAKAKSKEKVFEDLNAEEEALDDEVEHDVGIDEPPKEKRPGRPPKAQPGIDVNASETAAEEGRKVDIPLSDISAVNKGDSSPTKAALTRKDSNQQPKAREMPSPESTPPGESQTKPCSATHSPIKSITKSNGSGGFPVYRVGLSKTRKIPSLLKVVGKPRPDTRR
ncbi:hypothetical protein DOTSEDRAFT_55777 [Dothistroma septosporum NZE10]|uniref:Uncharacterized protein n=1 Tax=Dothistroma septosporum (strain NZE10 / CBS 128990) TaxID=675120 RepID=N1PH34_DOTSN|nr:hypothetical protein DOTSEDRAFT_55777 [Dothistroma septosporum NZE10]